MTQKKWTPEGFSLKIFKDRYAFTESETWDEACERVARQVALAEFPQKQKQYEDRFKEILVDNLFVPGGRIWYNSGRSNPQLLNCFVLDPNKDSKEGWGKSAYNIIITSMQGGGCGDDFSDIRPRGASISDQKGAAPGAVELMRLIDNCADPIRSGGQRRVALMFSLDLDHPDIEEFLNAKLVKGQLTHANVSIRSKDTKTFIKAVKEDLDWELSWKGKYKKTVKARDLWNTIVSNAYNSAEPGFLNWELVESESNISYIEPLVTTNPCLSGETFVAVADGRGNVSIKDLADIGKDVPVYCFNNKGKVVIRTMRNPRITGYQEDIYKVTLDDGSFIKVTKNHKFRKKNGEYTEVKDLQKGDSLEHMTKYHASIKDIFPAANSRSQDYMWVVSGQRGLKSEHRMIAEFHYNTKIQTNSVVHHIDFNALNNNPSNLRIMTRADHDALHGDAMRGNNNPMRRAKTEWSQDKWDNYRQKQSRNNSGSNNRRYGGFTNEQLKVHAIILTKEIGKRFSTKEWSAYAKRNDLPTQFSGYRCTHLNGGISGFAKWAALECGIEHADKTIRISKLYRDSVADGYDAEIINNHVRYHKKCELCLTPFIARTKEIGICSKKCAANKGTNTPHRLDNLRRFREEEKKDRKIVQLDIYTKIKSALGRDPLEDEWAQACMDLKIPYRIGKHSPFKKWTELKEAASFYNYRVMSVEYIGKEDVYNGTVDEFHNFFVGGFVGTTTSGKIKYGYLNNLQCGEIALSAYDCCCLGHLVLPRFISGQDINYASLGDTIRTAVRFLDNVLTVNNYPLPEMKTKSHNLRRIGLGTTGLADMLAMLNLQYGSEEGNKFIEKLYKFIAKTSYEASVMLAMEKGAFPLCQPEKHIESGFMKRMGPKVRSLVAEHGIRNCAILTQAPTGTVSILSGNCSSGIESMFAPAYERRYWDGDVRKVETVFHPLFAQFMKDGRDVSHFVGSRDLSVRQHLEVQKIIQKHVDNAVSKTINIAQDYPMKDVAEAWLEYLPYVKGTTFYRENTRGYVDEKGNIQEPPLMAIPIEQAIEMFKKHEQVVEDTETNDCATGVCEIK